ncbi:hypothetical protein JW707_04905 [Candidatus Woesearchaeota archaeon]|nr:hypothetical protein [Candidatus Woesearchaeota archaeon]
MLSSIVEAVFAIKKDPGVVFKGRNRQTEEAVFDAVAREFYDYFSDDFGIQNAPPRIMPTCSFRNTGPHSFYVPETDIHKFPVYLAEVPNIEYKYWINNRGELDRSQISEDPVKLGNVTLIQLAPEKKDEYRKDWDFAHAPFKIDKQTFLAYINMYHPKEFRVDKNASIDERNRFLDFVVRRNSGLKTNF